MQAIREIGQYCKLVYQRLGNRRRYERLDIEGTVNATWKDRYNQLITHIPMYSSMPRAARRPAPNLIGRGQVEKTGDIGTYKCKSIDLSRNGMALMSEEPAPISADVYLCSARFGLKSFAAVRYCAPEAKGYRIGLSFRAEPVVWDGY